MSSLKTQFITHNPFSTCLEIPHHGKSRRVRLQALDRGQGLDGSGRDNSRDKVILTQVLSLLLVYSQPAFHFLSTNPLLIAIDFMHGKYILYFYNFFSISCASLFCKNSGFPALVEECPAWWLQQQDCPVPVCFRTTDFKFNTLLSHPCQDRNLVGMQGCVCVCWGGKEGGKRVQYSWSIKNRRREYCKK